MRYLLLCLSLCSRLIAAPFDEITPSTPEEVASLNGDLLIEGFISPLSGQIFIHEADLRVKAAQDISLQRNYVPPQILGRYEDKDDFDQLLLGKALAFQESRRWTINPHLSAGFNVHSSYFQVRDPSGFVLEFELQGAQGILKTASYGMSNLGQGEPDSTADLRNIEFVMEKDVARVIWPDGTERIYRKQNSFHYRLEKELLPNGKAIRYEYSGRELARIISSDYSGKYTYATIEKMAENHYVGSDGREVRFNYEPLEVKGKVKQGNSKSEFSYTTHVLAHASNPTYSNSIQYNDRTLLSSYDAISYPVSFDYSKKKGVLARVQRLSTPSGSVSLSYNPPCAGKKGGWTKASYEDGAQVIYRFDKNLLLTAIENWHGDTFVNQKTFDYDANQHIRNIEIRDGSGALLIAHRYECDAAGNPLLEQIEGDSGTFSIKRTFSTRGRLVKEEREDGLEVEYAYLGNTRLLTSKTTTAHGEPLRKTTYTYDEANNLIEEIEEGVTRTKYTLYSQGAHLHRTEWKEEFDWENRLIRKIHFIYDGWANLAWEEHFGSDGILAYTIKKTYDSKGNLLEESNPLDQVASYQYDLRGHCTHEVPFSNKLAIVRSFDEKGRLTLLKEGEHATRFAYNASDELIEKIDYLGLKTNYTYDSVHGKPTLIESPPTLLKLKYDSFGREIERSDAYGALRRTRYNSYGKPIEIVYPDGGTELYSYASNGLLTLKTDPDGLKTSFIHDALGRILSKTEGLYQTAYSYDAYQLIEEIDPKGIVTRYIHNAQGQKIEEERAGRKTRFRYDPLGFLAAVERGGRSITYTRDPLGRLLEKSEDGLLKTRWTYDSAGSVATISQAGTTFFRYDPYNRLIEKIDAEGAKTVITYKEGDKILVKEIQDPRDVSTIETYNAHGKLLKKEIPGSLCEEFEYDRALRLIRHDHLTFAYTPGGYRASATEAGVRTTSWTYTPGGKIQTKIKPDGTHINYAYDLQGKLVKVGSREFSYDELGRLVQGSGFSRTLDPFGNLLREEFSNELSIESIYDDSDRPLERKLPDQSRIVYEYQGPFLKKVMRVSHSGSILYTHTYDQHNEAGLPLSETGLFQTTYGYDKTGMRRTLQANPYLTEHLSYDKAGNLIQRGAATYTYDDASQLTSETEKFTARYDEHYNCIERNGEPLAGIVYDENGNTEKPSFVFDAFGQLIEAEGEILTYDALGRRLQKGDTAYLYMDKEEIGAFEAQKLKELKIAGKQGPVAIEIDGHIYVPIQDVQGIIRFLVDHETGKVVKANDCDAFGSGLTDAIPYAYQGKRYDAKTGLIYFGQRYYDTKLNRWLTPDPIGDFDHSNLYQYVFNNPLTYRDLHGQFAIVIPLLFWGAELVLPTLATCVTAVVYTAAISTAAYAGYKVAGAINDSEYWKKNNERNTGPKPPYCGEKLGTDPLAPAAEGFEWKGKGEPGSEEGGWTKKPEKKEDLRSDFDHEGDMDPHWDFTNENGEKARLFLDGSWEWK